MTGQYDFPSNFIAAIDQAVLARHGRTERNEIRFQCPQPDHADHHPSARWNRAMGVWTCDSCKAGGGVLELADLLGIQRPEPVAQTKRKMPAPLGPAPDRRGERRFFFDYTDPDGRLRYQVIRIETTGAKKQFKIRRPNVQGDWIWNARGVERLPYRLPQLLASDPAQWRFVPEGEKCVDRIWDEGYPATTNSEGAGNWSSDLAKHLVGGRYAIILDNDQAGFKHGLSVYHAIESVSEDLTILQLTNVPPKGDIVDFLDAGGTMEGIAAVLAGQPRPGVKQITVSELTDLVHQEAPNEAGAEAENSPRLIVTSLAAVTAQPVDWIWYRWLAKRKIHILGGHPGDGKSTLTAYLAAVFSQGGGLPDGSCAPKLKTLFLLAEDALDDTLKPRLDAHDADSRNVFAIEAVREPDGNDRLFSLERNLPLLEAFIIANQIDVLVIDPVTSFMAKSDRNAEGDVRDLLTPVGKMAERTGVAVIAVMHIGKPSGTNRRPLQQLLGATAFGAVARVVWMVAEIPDGEDETRRVIGVVKSNLAMKPQPLEWSRAQDGPIVWHGPSSHQLDELLSGVQARPREDAMGFLTEKLRGGSQPVKLLSEWAKNAGITERTLRRAYEDLHLEKFKEPGVANGRWFWKLPNGNIATENASGHLPPKSKMATSKDGHVAIFDSSAEKETASLEKSHEIEKMATIATNGHLPRSGQIGHEIEDGHLAMLRNGHLRPNDVEEF